MRLKLRFFPALGVVLYLSSLCNGATVTGMVKGADGTPFQGAFVAAQNTKSRMTVYALSNSKGLYRIEGLSAGTYRLQIRAVGYSAEPRTGVNLTASQNASYNFALQQGTVRWSDISYSQAQQLWPKVKGEDLYVKNCTTCHLFQTRMASTVRDEEGWKDRVDYMREVMNVKKNVNDQDSVVLAGYLTSLFGPDSVLPASPADIPKYKDTVRPFSSESTNIVYVEYDMPGPSRMPFSAAPDKNGMMWIPNFGPANKLTRLDPKTGEMQDFTVPHVGTASLHSAVPAADGSVWITEQIANKVGRWDPKTQKITEYQDGTTGSKHTVRLDTAGRVWASGNPLTMFDPETEKFTRFPEVDFAYDVKPDKNGDVWFTNPLQNKIGKVDGKTMKLVQWTSPTADSFPRRMEIASDGMIWFGEFRGGKMGRFDPKTETFTEYVLPGPNPTPYSLGIDAEGYIWYNSHYMDTIGRFDTQTGKVIEYPFPHSEVNMREFFRDAQGRMWYGSNPNNKVGYFYLTGKHTDGKHGVLQTAKK
jgi:virginiamycin B lyase